MTVVKWRISLVSGLSGAANLLLSHSGCQKFNVCFQLRMNPLSPPLAEEREESGERGAEAYREVTYKAVRFLQEWPSGQIAIVYMGRC